MHPQFLPLPRTNGSPGLLLERCWHTDGARCERLSKHKDHRCAEHGAGEEHAWADAARWLEGRA